MRLSSSLVLTLFFFTLIQTIPRPQQADYTDFLWIFKSQTIGSIMVSLKTDFTIKGLTLAAKWTLTTSRYLYFLDSSGKIVIKFFIEQQDSFGKWHLQGIQLNLKTPQRVYLEQLI